MTIPTLEQIDAALAERSLSRFIRLAWPVIEPGTDYLHNWHVDCICELLQAVDAGQVTRLLINMPPRYAKSICVSVMWPVWSWLAKPESRWLFASYAADLSTQHSVDRRTIIQSDWYQRLWGDRFRLTSDQNVKTEYRNDHQGRMFATSFGGVATGKGGDRIVIDDPHDPKGAESDKQRETTVTTFSRKLSTRLNNKKTGAIVVVMQRLHTKDVSAVCIEQGYTHLCLPAEDEPGKIISAPSGKVFRRDDSGLLWPEREGPKEIAQAKKQLLPYGYAGQYQQKPSPDGGGKFKEAWFRYWKREGEWYRLDTKSEAGDKLVKPEQCQRFVTADIACTVKQAGSRSDPDYTVFSCWDLTPDGDLILVDAWRDRKEEPDVVREGLSFIRRHGPEMTLIEKNGVGSGVVSTLKLKNVGIRGINVKNDKVVRAGTAILRVEGGSVYFPATHPALFDLTTELTQFPNGAHDDFVDTLSLAATYGQNLKGALKDNTDLAHAASRDEAAAQQEEADRQAERVAAHDVAGMWAGYDDD